MDRTPITGETRFRLNRMHPATRDSRLGEVVGDVQERLLVIEGAVRVGLVPQNGTGTTAVVFGDDAAATVTADNAEPYDLSAVGSGATLIVDFDGDGEKTVTLGVGAGLSISGATPSTDISGGTDTSLMISLDGDDAEAVVLVLAGLSSGAAIATALEAAIRALEGNKALVTVDYNVTTAGKYTIASALLGTASAVVVTDAAENSVAAALKLGAANGGYEMPGWGDCVSIRAVTAAELAEVCFRFGVAADEVGGALRLTSATAGDGSSLVIGAGTANDVLGFTENEEYYGAPGLGYATNMKNAAYNVIATPEGATPTPVGVDNLAAGGFDLISVSGTSTDLVHLLVIGVPA